MSRALGRQEADPVRRYGEVPALPAIRLRGASGARLLGKLVQDGARLTLGRAGGRHCAALRAALAEL